MIPNIEIITICLLSNVFLKTCGRYLTPLAGFTGDERDKLGNTFLHQKKGNLTINSVHTRIRINAFAFQSQEGIIRFFECFKAALWIATVLMLIRIRIRLSILMKIKIQILLPIFFKLEYYKFFWLSFPALTVHIIFRNLDLPHSIHWSRKYPFLPRIWSGSSGISMPAYIFVDTLCWWLLVFVHQSDLYMRISTTAAMYWIQPVHVLS